MTGVAWEITFDDAAIMAGLDRVEACLVDSSPLLAQIGAYGVASTHRRFECEAGPDGQPWPGLNPAYEQLKDASIGAGFKMLYASGDLYNSQRFVAGPGEVSWGSSMVYAAAHQFGATITAKGAKALAFVLGDTFTAGHSGAMGKTQAHLVLTQSVTLPARPYLGLDEDDRAEISALAADYIRDQFLSGP